MPDQMNGALRVIGRIERSISARALLKNFVRTRDIEGVLDWSSGGVYRPASHS
jgi:hypothetical protein